MPRIRSIKPEAFQSESLSKVSLEAERTLFGLSTQVDDRGRISDKPAQINGFLWAMRGGHSAEQLDTELKELESEGIVCRYTGCNGHRYLHLVKWDDHQVINRPSPSRLPRCPHHLVSVTGTEEQCGRHEGACMPPDPSVSPHAHLSEPSTQDLGSRNLDRGSRTVEEHHADEDAGRGDVERICAHLADRIEGNGSKRPAIGKRWLDSARLMLDRDQRTEDQIHAAIDWCQNDEFWRANILSMPKLREKYEQLRLQASRNGTTKPSTTDQRVAAIQALKTRSPEGLT